MSEQQGDAPVVIVGTGHAGATLAREFRKLDDATPLVIVTEDDGALYYKPNLSKALADNKGADDLITQPAEKAAEQFDARWISGQAVTAIDTAGRTLTVGSGDAAETIGYRDLVLATGAQQRACPVPGDHPQVHSVNHLDHYRRFRDALAQHDAAKVVILGAGLIGCEFANDLASAGHTVHLIDPQQHPLAALVPQAIGEALRKALESAGVHFHLGTTAAALTDNAVTLETGETLPADLVLSAIGLLPTTELAGQAGLQTDRGIVVDRQLQTSAEHVYAIGDGAQLPGGHVLPYVLPITHSARALAKTLAGQPTELALPAMPVTVKTPALPTVVCPPPAGAEGEWAVTGDAPDLVGIFADKQGAALGFALTGAATKQRGALARELPALLG